MDNLKEIRDLISDNTKRITINSRPAKDPTNVNRVVYYKNPYMQKLAQEAFERGDSRFFVKVTTTEPGNWPLVELDEPRYSYSVELSQLQYDRLFELLGGEEDE